MIRKVVIDGSLFQTKEQFYEYLKDQCGFPQYFGGNLDAFADIISERRLSTVYEISNSEAFVCNLGEYGSVILQILRDNMEMEG